MDLKQFVETYLGKRVDFDGYAGAQCVDLYRQYCKDALGMPPSERVESAKHLWERYDGTRVQKQYLQKTANTPAFVPEPGDIAVFGGGQHGHVAIVLYANNVQMVLFEQDGYAQDGAKPAMRDYKNVLGFLRPLKI